MPLALQQAMENLDRDCVSQGEPAQFSSQQPAQHNFLEVVKATKRSGINVVPIDCFHNYKSFGGNNLSTEGSHEWIMMMNFLSAKRIKAVQHDADSGKWAAFVSEAHANTCCGVPGRAKFTGGVTIVVDDETPVDGMRLSADVEHYKANTDSNLPEGLPRVDVVFSPGRKITSSHV